ncbi:MAG: hypothetical protein HWD86_11430 [Kangiellaceae bacterium]|nr:hypothetical protein [Kangiellaceae bacterium]
MKLFIRLFIFLIIAAALAYGYIWYKNKQAVDGVFQQLSMMTSASYDSTYVSLDGKSVTKNIKITFPGTSTEATIDELHIGAGSLPESFKLVRSIETKQFDEMPSEIGAKIKGFKFPISLDLDANDNFASQPDLFTQMQFAGCGNKQTLAMSEYVDLGYSQVAMDLETKVAYDKHINQANWNMYVTAPDYGSFKMDFLMDNLNFLAPNPKLKSISLEMINDGFVNKLNDFCAQQVELEASQYAERHLAYLQHLLYNNDIYLSEDFYSKYTDYVNNPHSIKLSSFPDNALDAMQLMTMSPQLLISRLNLNVAINDKEVGQLLGNRPDPSQLPMLDEVSEIKETLKTVQGLTLQATDKASIGKYVGYDAYFRYRGKDYKGNIVSVSGNTARVNTALSAGNYVQMPFSISDIRNLKIRREYIIPSEEGEEESPNQ